MLEVRTEVLHNLITHSPQAKHPPDLYLFHVEHVCVCVYLHVKVLPFIPSLLRFVVLAPEDVGRQNKTTSHLIWRRRRAKQVLIRGEITQQKQSRDMTLMLLLLNITANILN